MAFVYINKYIRLNEEIRAEIIRALNDAISYNNYSRNEYSLIYDIKKEIEKFPRLQPPTYLLSKFYINEEWDEEFNSITAAEMDIPPEDQWKNEYLNDLKRVILNKIMCYVEDKKVSENTAEILIKTTKLYRVPREKEEQVWNNV